MFKGSPCSFWNALNHQAMQTCLSLNLKYVVLLSFMKNLVQDQQKTHTDPPPPSPQKYAPFAQEHQTSDCNLLRVEYWFRRCDPEGSLGGQRGWVVCGVIGFPSVWGGGCEGSWENEAQKPPQRMSQTQKEGNN